MGVRKQDLETTYVWEEFRTSTIRQIIVLYTGLENIGDKNKDEAQAWNSWILSS